MQDILGHADAETTLNIHTTMTKDLKREEMTNLNDHFKLYGKLVIHSEL